MIHIRFAKVYDEMYNISYSIYNWKLNTLYIEYLQSWTGFWLLVGCFRNKLKRQYLSIRSSYNRMIFIRNTNGTKPYSSLHFGGEHSQRMKVKLSRVEAVMGTCNQKISSKPINLSKTYIHMLGGILSGHCKLKMTPKLAWISDRS